MKVTARILKRKGKSDGAIQIVVYYRGQQKEFSLGRSLPIPEWDRVRQEARGAKNQMVNVLIRNTKNDIYQILSNDMATASASDLSELMDTYLTKRATDLNDSEYGNSEGGPTLIEYLEGYISNNPDQVSFGTMNAYRTLLFNLKGFGTKLRVNELDIKFLTGFQKYMTNSGKQVNAAATNLAKLRKLLGYAYKDKLIDEIPFGRYSFQIKRDRTSKSKYLNDEEISQILNFNPETKSELVVMSIVRFKLHLGLRIGDVLTLRKSDFIVEKENGVYTYRCIKMTRKTNKGINILLTKQATAELLANDFAAKKRNDLVFPMLNDSDFRDEETLYKAIGAKTAYINKVIKEIATSVGVKHFSSHTLRHSFGTTLINKGVPLTSISKLMGHSSIKTTEIYSQLVQPTIDEHVKLLEG